jgi:hypothetical protein
MFNKLGGSAKFLFELEGRSILKNRRNMKLLRIREAFEHHYHFECWGYEKKVCSVERNDQEVEETGNAKRLLA